MSKEEQIIIDGVNIFDTLDNWADLISQEWCSGEYPVAEIIKNYILDINKQLARKTQECEELKNTLEKLTRGVVLPAIPEPDVINLTDSYRKALEEIKKYTREQFCDNCEDISSTEYNCHCEYCEYQEYFDIIDKAKG